jgi:hypothetical protein
MHLGEKLLQKYEYWFPFDRDCETDRKCFPSCMKSPYVEENEKE